MKFSEQWLRSLCNPALTTMELCDKLTMGGLEVESAVSADSSEILSLPLDAHTAKTSLCAAPAFVDALIDVKTTPNRADCLSLVGIAREVSAMTGAKLNVFPVATTPVAFAGTRTLRVEAAAGCPRFAARLIDGINAQNPTPEWMQQRLRRSGIRSISAVVDITNYVMLECGQPLHAYDDRLLAGDIVVRFARPGEKLPLLNGEIIALEPDYLLVADEAKPLGLAGIMGGKDSSIANDTTRVYLEGAFWNPAVIQGRMRRLGFATDAGYRFERGVDFDGCARAVERATQLILDICGGAAGPLTDAVSAPDLPHRDPVRVRTTRVAKLLGMQIEREAIADIFARLGLPFSRDGDDFVVTPPSFRFDLSIEEDFIEEIARIFGYDLIPATSAAHIASMLPDPETARSLNVVKQQLVALDWQEIVTFSFVSSATEAALDPGTQPVRVLNPIASQMDVMRTSLLPGLLTTLQTNLNRQQARVRVFELGRTFARNGDGYAQPLRLGGVAYGSAAPEQWGERLRNVDFFDVKGDLEILSAPRRLATPRTVHPALHPGRAAHVQLDGALRGWLGELHPRLVRYFDLPSAPVLFELDAATLTTDVLPFGEPVSALPIVRRDIAIVVAEEVPAGAVLAALLEARAPHVESVRLFDVYRGSGLTEGWKSLAILVLMQDTSRTLTDAEIDATMATLLRVVSNQFGGSLRSQVS
ncbi:MAG: phenylalanine--tRNA ligase subunit beta [Casimicrobiaceae bacterium]